jgi:hypothetical protein
MKGPLHGGAPSEVVEQIHKVGTPEHAEEWVRDAIARGERLMGFGHRVYRAYDPRAAALRQVAEGMAGMADWLKLAVAVEDMALRKLAERHPDRPLKTNVEYYAAAVLQGVGLPPDLFPATFAWPPRRLDGARPRAGGGKPTYQAGRALRGAAGAPAAGSWRRALTGRGGSPGSAARRPTAAPRCSEYAGRCSRTGRQRRRSSPRPRRRR